MSNQNQRPNIVLMYADDMGYGDFGAYNDGHVQTPNLDALIGESLCLSQHYSGSPVCSPARAALLTGRYSHRTGAVTPQEVRGMDRIATREATIGDTFKAAGYVTGMVGKWHNGALDPRYHPNARGFDERFLMPALELLDDRLVGIIFEQEYLRKNERPEIEEFVVGLDRFFRDVPANVQFHLEIRTAAFHVPMYLDWLADHGLGFVFSHSTWQKPLREQWQYVGKRFTAANGEAVVRLLTPLKLRYPQAFDLTHPFEGPVAQIVESEEGQAMVDDTVALAEEAIAQHKTVNLVLNNRAWGSAPDLAREIAGHSIQRRRLHGRGLRWDLVTRPAAMGVRKQPPPLA
ncbi:MAG: sulfatase-like hydrolase/transferase, partial [Chloroflexi bacterium]|nr:sulfatase-like hydrolase/transferase [Chloroflexota bacterium]